MPSRTWSDWASPEITPFILGWRRDLLSSTAWITAILLGNGEKQAHFFRGRSNGLVILLLLLRWMLNLLFLVPEKNSIDIPYVRQGLEGQTLERLLGLTLGWCIYFLFSSFNFEGLARDTAEVLWGFSAFGLCHCRCFFLSIFFF